jgi:hypothetical protein
MLRLGTVAGVVTVGAGISGYDIAKAADASQIPWAYKKFNIKKTMKRAYENYAVLGKGCSYAVFEALAGTAAEKNGTYDSFPWTVATVGSGGVAHWGAICGTLNGAAWGLSLLLAEPYRSQVIQELFVYYESEKLPNYKPKKPLKSDKNVKRTKANAIQCHVSIEAWVDASGAKKGSAEQKERCACLCASIAGKAARMLNDVLKEKYVAGDSMGKVAAGCMECHDGSATHSAVLSHADCTTCHDDAHNQ